MYVSASYIQSLNWHYRILYDMPQDVILRCIFDSLSILGENTKAALMANLQKEGVGFTPDTFDIEKFSDVITELLGNSADFVLIKILDDASKKLNMTPEQEKASERAFHYQSSSGLLRTLFAIAK